MWIKKNNKISLTTVSAILTIYIMFVLLSGLVSSCSKKCLNKYVSSLKAGKIGMHLYALKI